MAETVLREARTEDLRALLALYGELADRESAQAGEVADSMASMQAMLADPSRHLLVAEREERIVGTVDLLIAANLTHRCEPWAIVENVVVADEVRREGIGRALMLRALDLARSAGCYKVQLLSGNARGPAHALYRSIGMESVAEGFKIYLDGAGAPQAPGTS